MIKSSLTIRSQKNRALVKGKSRFFCFVTDVIFSIFVSEFFCDVFLGKFKFYVKSIVVYSKIISDVLFILSCTKL